MKKLMIMFILVFTFTLQACTATQEYQVELIASSDTVEINGTWSDPGAKFIIGTVQTTFYSKDEVDTTKLGIYKINYTYIYEGLTYGNVRYVVVVDQTKPVIVLSPGIDTIRVGETWTDAGATVTDNSGEVLTIVVSGTIDNKTVGIYMISYTATDSSGNTKTVIRYVDVLNSKLKYTK